MPNKPAPLTAEEILTETRRMIDSKRWRSTATALNAYREFIDMAMPRMMDIVEQQREQIAALEKEPQWKILALDQANQLSAKDEMFRAVETQHVNAYKLLEKDAADAKNALMVSEQYRRAYADGKYRLYSMGGKITDAAAKHLPASEGPLDRYTRKIEREHSPLLVEHNTELIRQIEALKKERDSLRAELQKWMERFGPAAEASCPR